MTQKYKATDKSVLIVDDSIQMQKEIASAYQSFGFKTIAFGINGEEAIELYKEHRPDLISLDIIMPVMHGIDCYWELKSEFPNINAVFISCLASEEIIGESFVEKIPAHLFIPKPLELETLSNCLKLLFSPEEAKTLPKPPQELNT